MDADHLQHIDRLIQQRPVAKTALEAYRELASLMIQSKPETMGIPEDEHLQIRRKEGFPLFSRESLPLDIGAASALLNQFFKCLSKTRREDQTGLVGALKQSDTDSKWTDRLVTTILKQDEETLATIANQMGLDPPVLLFLGKTALRPSLVSIRHLMEHGIREEHWNHGYCPLCGSQPDMARFTKTGKRRLHCELCGEEWAFARIECPFCNNREQKDLGYFEADEEEGLRVYFCHSCHRYLKTIDSRVFEELAPLELENLATLHLDVIARENGFK